MSTGVPTDDDVLNHNMLDVISHLVQATVLESSLVTNAYNVKAQ